MPSGGASVLQVGAVCLGATTEAPRPRRATSPPLGQRPWTKVTTPGRIATPGRKSRPLDESHDHSSNRSKHCPKHEVSRKSRPIPTTQTPRNSAWRKTTHLPSACSKVEIPKHKAPRPLGARSATE
eukprot:15435132-Alexandrium_andersonii.AAC.1